MTTEIALVIIGVKKKKNIHNLIENIAIILNQTPPFGK